MAIFSPIIGKKQYKLGRRNILQYGLCVIGIPFFGYFMLQYCSNAILFILIFICLRLIQGVGTSMAQTPILAILTLTYPDRVNFVVGCLETAAGLGLTLGPLCGTILYNIGGLKLPFLTFFVILTITGLFVRQIIPDTVEEAEDDEVDTSKISYIELLSDKRIFFANLSVLLGLVSYTFIDPVLANHLHDEYGLSYENSGYFFLAIGCGYMSSSLLVNITTRKLENRHICMICAVLCGLFTMLYTKSEVLNNFSNIHTTLIALILSGMTISHL